MRGEFVDLDDTRLYCYAAGSRGAGEPVVLVHGAFASSHMWRDVTTRVPKGHRILVVDLLGHGRSDQPPDAPLDVAAHARRLAALLRTLGVGPACLVGHGVGAAIASRMALDHPTEVTRLLLCNPCLVAAGDMRPTPPLAMRRVAAMGGLWRRLPPDWLASALHTSLLRGYTNRLSAGYSLDIYLRPFRSAAGRAVAIRQLRAATTDVGVHLAPRSLTIPVGVVLGVRDPFVGPRGEQLRAALGDVSDTVPAVHRLIGLSHGIPEEAPDLLALAVAELLAR